MPRKLIQSLGFANRGLVYILKTQRNMQIHILLGLLVLLFALILGVERWEIVALLSAIFLVIITEMINTAIEEVVNLATLSHKARAMVAKDISAASVLVASLGAIIIGCLILGEKLIRLCLK